jgi:hypothetical protein
MNTTTAAYTWSWGETETVHVHRTMTQDGETRSFVSWPDSRRELNGRTVERVPMWVPTQNISPSSEHNDDCLFCAAGEAMIHHYEPPNA